MNKFLLLITLITLVACSPEVQPYTPSTGQPGIVDAAFHTGGGDKLPLRIYLPDAQPRAVIVALHGFNDYSRAFEGAGAYFSMQDIALYAYDQRGFGENAIRGVWAGEENLVADLKQMVQAVGVLHPMTPIYILGESMGGAVAITALADPTFPKVNGLILISPAVWGEDTMSPIYRATLWVLAHTIPDQAFTGSGLKIQATNNIPLLRRMSADPLVIKETRVDAVYGIVGLMDSAYQRAEKVQTPTLLIYGGKDQVIPFSPVRETAEHLTAPHRLAYYPDGYHMILRDLEGDERLSDIVHWIDAPNMPLPSGAEEAWKERVK